jgi:transcriptional regulator with XRE-family HTH domain
LARREELSRFLKCARGRIAPADVGLPPTGRRRAQGLRREEVASLTGMSVSWYTWFEQGRDVQLSAQMLEKLSKTLKLSTDEREFLFALAQGRPPPIAEAPEHQVSPDVQHLLDYLNVPALMMLPDWTIIGWNRLHSSILRDWSKVPAGERNLFKNLLLDPRYRAHEEMFRKEIRRCVARFKWDYSRAADPAPFETIIDELNEKSELFRDYWPEPTVRSCYDSVNAIFQDGVGWIAFRQTSFTLEQSPAQRLVLFAPLDEPSEEKLELIRAKILGSDKPVSEQGVARRPVSQPQHEPEVELSGNGARPGR